MKDWFTIKEETKIEIIKLLEEKYPNKIFSLGEGVYNPITFYPRTQILGDGILFGYVEIKDGEISIFVKR
jgi:hypothetical protein